MENPRQQRHLAQRRKRLYARQDGHGDTGLTAARHKVKEFFVVEKHLRDDIRGAAVYFRLEMLQVGVEVHRLLVFLRISGYAESHRARRRLYACAVGHAAIVEIHYLVGECGGVKMSFGAGGE